MLKLARKLIVGISIMVVVATASFAAYPEKNIKLIVPFGAGGGTDLVARALGASVEKILGQPVVVINKIGGSGAVGMSEGAVAKADGYTVTMITRELVSLPQMGMSPISPKDFKLIALINEDSAIVLVHPESQYKNVKEVIKAAKAAPGTVKFASSAKPNFYVLGLGLVTGTSYNQIPYNGAAEAIPALMGKHVEFTMVGPAEAISQLLNKQLIGLGIASSQRMEALPDIPTLTELGIPLITGSWRGIAVPLKTPANVIAKLEDAFAQAVKDPIFVKFMNSKTFGIHYLGGKDFETFIKNDWNAMSEIVKAVKAQQN